MAKVLLIESQPLLMHGLCQILMRANSATEVVVINMARVEQNAAENQNADLVILSVLPELPATDALLDSVRTQLNPQKILLLSDDAAFRLSSLRSAQKIFGCVRKTESLEVLDAAIRLVMVGGYCFPGDGQEASGFGVMQPFKLNQPAHSHGPDGRSPVAGAELLNITPRQYEVLVLLARGYPIKTVSRMLNISVATAKTHACTLYQRLNVKNKSEAVYAALQRGATLDWKPSRSAGTDGTPEKNSNFKTAGGLDQLLAGGLDTPVRTTFAALNSGYSAFNQSAVATA